MSTDDILNRIKARTEGMSDDAIGSEYIQLVGLVGSDALAMMARAGFTWITVDQAEADEQLLHDATEEIERRRLEVHLLMTQIRMDAYREACS